MTAALDGPKSKSESTSRTHPVEGVEVRTQRGDTGLRGAIRVTPILGRQLHYQAQPFETVECPVQGPRSELDSREFFDVLNQCVAMFGTVSEAREDEDGRVTGSA